MMPIKKNFLRKGSSGEGGLLHEDSGNSAGEMDVEDCDGDVSINSAQVEMLEVRSTPAGIARTSSIADLVVEPGPPNPPVLADGFLAYLKKTLWLFFTDSWMNILLICVPLAFVAEAKQWKAEIIFVLALLSLCPLAERISFVTEDVAKYTNDTLGGFLNATFGNVTELIVCIFALKEGLLRVVQVSMLGSIMSNLLLVQGCAFFFGGLKNSEQTFNIQAAVTNVGLLVIALGGLTMPTLLTATNLGRDGPDSVTEIVVVNASHHITTQEIPGGIAPIGLSRFIAVSMLVVYFALMVFQMKTHTHIYEGESNDEDEEPPVLGFWGGVVWLGIISILISYLSDMLVEVLEESAANLGVPVMFVATILIPIVGNAAEHAAAVIFAIRNKMEISLGIAVGSSVQIAAFVIPLCVVMGWAMDQPMSLDFHIFEVITCYLTVFLTLVSLQNGKSHWLKGFLLCFMYLIIASAYWCRVDD